MLNSTLVGRFNVSVGATPPTVAFVPMADVTMPVARVFFQIAFSDADPNDRVNTANIGTGCVGCRTDVTNAATHAGKHQRSRVPHFAQRRERARGVFVQDTGKR
jgi:hypothetical protein